jgi:YD repeat-containing protein
VHIKDPVAGSYVYHYDAARVTGANGVAGRLAWVEEPTGGVDFAYDSFGHQNWMRRTINGDAAEKAVRWSPSGLVLSLTYDDGLTVPTTYDGAGRPTAVGTYWQATKPPMTARAARRRWAPTGRPPISTRPAV